ncbi:MAG: DUF1003 domain-containing protein [Bacillus sp. (in: firmicutes)]
MSKKKTKEELIKQLIESDNFTDEMDDLIERLIDEPISFDVDKESDRNLTFGDRAADKITAIAGSWGFIIAFTVFLIFWMVLNYFLAQEAPDPYPFILLNLMLSCLAALQAPIIMMSQNRQSQKDSQRSQYDYHTDLKSELILEKLHDQILELEKNQKEILNYLKESDK